METPRLLFQESLSLTDPASLHKEAWYSALYVSVTSVAQSCLTLCDPMDCSSQASLSITGSQSLLKLMSIKSVMTE